ncbi:MAG: histidine phosphatase family protein [Candidatus Nanopelagicales bacterium]|nr:histidine phosphatase family protein [Candidatus Nanopelagicales bacterium]
MSERTLVVMRHAKSDWPLGVADADRPLALRGRRDAFAAARWLVAEVPVIDRVWLSPATRTRQTWEIVSRDRTDEPVICLEPAVYAAPGGGLLEVIRTSADEDRVVALVAHNPGCQDLAESLADSGSDSAALERVRVKYPTMGIAVLRFVGPWSDLDEGRAQLVEFAAPRGI